jgi:hypothetical protein
MKIDVTTRQPFPEVKPVRSAGFVAALRALFSGGILLLAVGCGPSKDAQGYEPVDTPMVIFKYGPLDTVKVFKLTDDTDNNVCYLAVSSTNTDLHCMVKFNDPSR